MVFSPMGIRLCLSPQSVDDENFQVNRVGFLDPFKGLGAKGG